MERRNSVILWLSLLTFLVNFVIMFLIIDMEAKGVIYGWAELLKLISPFIGSFILATATYLLVKKH